MYKINVKRGDIYHNLIICEEVDRVTKERRFRCKCKCGKETDVDLNLLRFGNTKSCGCLKKENQYFTHRMSYTRQMNIWGLMRDRCNNKNSRAYPKYGGRGIKVCKEWETFSGFWKDMINGYEDNLTLDRINNDKGYSRENCRWASWQVQQNNRRNNTILSIDGKQDTLANWCRFYKIKPATVCVRIKKGYKPKEALTLPLGFRIYK